jgi:hypothetical protein
VKARGSSRKSGGISRSIDCLRSNLVSADPSDEAAKPGAVLELSRLINVAIEETMKGDAPCGCLLAELYAFLSKNRHRLSAQNEIFEMMCSSWKSARLATKKESPLRALIHGIIMKVWRERKVHQITKLIPHFSPGLKPDEALIALPEFANSEQAISAWTEVVVYPRLRAMESELRKHPVIGNLPKALDPNGKFHVSRLKPVIQQTVARIAAVPRPYYFNLA